MSLTYWDAIGGAGMALIFVAYTLNYQRIVKRDSRVYDYLNFFGAFILLNYALTTNGLIFIILNLVWTGLALYHIILREIIIIAGRQKPAEEILAKKKAKQMFK